MRTNEKKMEKKTVKRTVYVMNEYHVKVKKCCACCLYKRIDYMGNRVCLKDRRHRVPSNYRCPLWEMNSVSYAGKRWGTVKRLTDVVIN